MCLPLLASCLVQFEFSISRQIFKVSKPGRCVLEHGKGEKLENILMSSFFDNIHKYNPPLHNFYVNLTVLRISILNALRSQIIQHYC